MGFSSPQTSTSVSASTSTSPVPAPALGTDAASESAARPDPFDIYNQAAILRRWPAFSDFLKTPPPTASSTLDQASAFLLSLLWKDKSLRRRFPRALTDGPHGPFAKHLNSLAPSAAPLFREVLENPPGLRVLDYYIRETRLHSIFPAGLVPGAQKRIIRWLFDRGCPDHGLHAPDIISFMRICQENPAHLLAISWLIQPSWQTDFPDALTPAGAPAFLAWIDETFAPLADPLPASEFPPELSNGHGFPRIGTPLPRVLPWTHPARWKSLFRPAARPQSRPAAAASAASRDPGPAVNILAPFCYPSGLGRAASITVAALEAAGSPVSCRDLPTPHEAIPRRTFLGSERHPVTIIHSLPESPGPELYRSIGWPWQDGKYRIGLWYWELELVPQRLLDNMEGLREIWAPTRFIAGLLRKSVSIPVHDMLPAVPVPTPGKYTRRDFHIPETGFLFLTMFDMASTFQRKNPLATVAAFRLAATPGSILLIKVVRGSCDPVSLAKLQDAARDTPGVILMDELLPLDKTMALMALCDCYISLHRSEGLGLTMAEAMLLGKPAIATRYSGNLDFMNDGNSLLVNHSLVPVGPGVPIYPEDAIWAEPSVEEAAAHIRWIQSNPAEARQLGEKARRECTELLSLEAYGKRLQDRLRAIPLNA